MRTSQKVDCSQLRRNVWLVRMPQNIVKSLKKQNESITELGHMSFRNNKKDEPELYLNFSNWTTNPNGESLVEHKLKLEKLDQKMIIFSQNKEYNSLAMEGTVIEKGTFAKVKNRNCQEKKVWKEPKDVLKKQLLDAFEDYEYYLFDDLKKMTNESEALLREVLEEIGNSSQSEINQEVWKLKKEFGKFEKRSAWQKKVKRKNKAKHHHERL